MAGKSMPAEDRDPTVDQVLRAKYLDYCSARVAELLLRLTPDEMYLLAQDVTRDLNAEEEGVPSYSDIVRLATDRISSQLSLPDFRSWEREYRKDPERFEREMIGLWESDLKASDRNSG